MNKSKFFALCLLSFGLTITSCGGTGGKQADQFHDAYEFSKIEKVKSESVRTVLERYNGSYLEFSYDDRSHTHYKFSYIISMSYNGTDLSQWYDEYGNYTNMGNEGLKTTYLFTFVDGKRTTGNQQYQVSFELSGDSLRGHVKNGDEEMGSFLMNNVERRKPSYLNTANYESRLYMDPGSDYASFWEPIEKFIDSKAYYDGATNIAFTYYAPYNGTQNCVVKEEGVITDTKTDDYENAPYVLKINKQTKYFHDEKVSEEVVDITRGFIRQVNEYDYEDSINVTFIDESLTLQLSKYLTDGPIKPY